MILKKSKKLNLAVIGLYFTILLFSAYIIVMFFGLGQQLWEFFGDFRKEYHHIKLGF